MTAPALVVCALLAACGSGDASPRGAAGRGGSDGSVVRPDAAADAAASPPRVEIGQSVMGKFTALAAGGAVPVVRGPQGFNMIVLALRAWSVEPRMPPVHLLAWVDTVQVGEVIDKRDLVPGEADSFELGDYYLAFYDALPTSTYMNQNVRVKVTIGDGRGNLAASEITVLASSP